MAYSAFLGRPFCRIMDATLHEELSEVHFGESLEVSRPSSASPVKIPGIFPPSPLSIVLTAESKVSFLVARDQREVNTLHGVGSCCWMIPIEDDWSRNDHSFTLYVLTTMWVEYRAKTRMIFITQGTSPTVVTVLVYLLSYPKGYYFSIILHGLWCLDPQYPKAVFKSDAHRFRKREFIRREFVIWIGNLFMCVKRIEGACELG